MGYYHIIGNKVLPKVSNYLLYWECYFDDTYVFVVPGKIDFILGELNFYHPSIKFKDELEEDKNITFLDVPINRTESKYQHLHQLVFQCIITVENWNIMKSHH